MDVFGNSCQKYEEDDLDESLSKISISGNSLRSVNSDNAVVLNAKHPWSNKQCINSAMLQRFYLESKIPKDLITLDEKYLWSCLELIHNRAFSKADAFKISVELSNPTTTVECSSDDDLMMLLLDNCLATDTGGQWIMGSKSMINIMQRRLLQCPDGEDINLRISSSTGSCKDFSSENVGGSDNQYLGMFSSSLDHGNKDTTPMEGHVTDTGHCTFASLESRNFSASSAAPSAGSASQGMLHVTWKGGIPHFVFSMDDQKEVYFTNLTNAGTCSEGSPLYIYLFYSKVGDHTTTPLHLVGEMKVTTSYTVCSHDSKITETTFGLSVTVGETQGASDNLRSYKGLPKKVVDLFRNSKYFKRRSMVSFDANYGIPLPQASHQEARASLDKLKQRSMSSFDGNLDTPFPEKSQEGRPNLSRSGGENPIPNHEMAAIVVKGHCGQVKSAGGWGLKFLRNAEARKTGNSWGGALLPDCFSQSPVMDIIIPAGIHGKPRTMDDGEPSTLMERWRSGGQCGCGGWDLGCPLTILKIKSTPEVSFDKAEHNVEFITQGSKQSIPTLRMNKLREGLYLVHFQPSLSALQSFSIAVAHIHTQSHSLGRDMHINMNDTEMGSV